MVCVCVCVCVCVGVILTSLFSKPVIFPHGNLKTVPKFKLVCHGEIISVTCSLEV